MLINSDDYVAAILARPVLSFVVDEETGETLLPHVNDREDDGGGTKIKTITRLTAWLIGYELSFQNTQHYARLIPYNAVSTHNLLQLRLELSTFLLHTLDLSQAHQVYIEFHGITFQPTILHDVPITFTTCDYNDITFPTFTTTQFLTLAVYDQHPNRMYFHLPQTAESSNYLFFRIAAPHIVIDNIRIQIASYNYNRNGFINHVGSYAYREVVTHGVPLITSKTIPIQFPPIYDLRVTTMVKPRHLTPTARSLSSAHRIQFDLLTTTDGYHEIIPPYPIHAVDAHCMLTIADDLDDDNHFDDDEYTVTTQSAGTIGLEYRPFDFEDTAILTQQHQQQEVGQEELQVITMNIYPTNQVVMCRFYADIFINYDGADQTAVFRTSYQSNDGEGDDDDHEESANVLPSHIASTDNQEDKQIHTLKSSDHDSSQQPSLTSSSQSSLSLLSSVEWIISTFDFPNLSELPPGVLVEFSPTRESVSVLVYNTLPSDGDTIDLYLYQVNPSSYDDGSEIPIKMTNPYYTPPSPSPSPSPSIQSNLPESTPFSDPTPTHPPLHIYPTTTTMDDPNTVDEEIVVANLIYYIQPGSVVRQRLSPQDIDDTDSQDDDASQADSAVHTNPFTNNNDDDAGDDAGANGSSSPWNEDSQVRQIQVKYTGQHVPSAFSQGVQLNAITTLMHTPQRAFIAHLYASLNGQIIQRLIHVPAVTSQYVFTLSITAQEHVVPAAQPPSASSTRMSTLSQLVTSLNVSPSAVNRHQSIQKVNSKEHEYTESTSNTSSPSNDSNNTDSYSYINIPNKDGDSDDGGNTIVIPPQEITFNLSVESLLFDEIDGNFIMIDLRRTGLHEGDLQECVLVSAPTPVVVVSPGTESDATSPALTYNYSFIGHYVLSIHLPRMYRQGSPSVVSSSSSSSTASSSSSSTAVEIACRFISSTMTNRAYPVTARLGETASASYVVATATAYTPAFPVVNPTSVTVVEFMVDGYYRLDSRFFALQNVIWETCNEALLTLYHRDGLSVEDITLEQLVVDRTYLSIAYFLNPNHTSDQTIDRTILDTAMRFTAQVQFHVLGNFHNDRFVSSFILGSQSLLTEDYSITISAETTPDVLSFDVACFDGDLQCGMNCNYQCKHLQPCQSDFDCSSLYCNKTTQDDAFFCDTRN